MPLIDKHLAPASLRSPDESLDVRRYLDALRRDRWLILTFVIVATASAVILGSLVPNRYTAETRIVFEEPGNPLGNTDVEAIERQLVTTDSLIKTPRVLDRVAARLQGTTRAELEEAVNSEVDDDASIITIKAETGDAKSAAVIANGVADEFIAERTERERARLRRARESLLAEITALQGSPSAESQISAVRERISELAVAQAGAGSELEIIERAEPPEQRTSPRPLRNGVLAFVAALFLGVLFALGRDLLRPRITGARELSRLTRLTVLAGVPYVRSWTGRKSRYGSAAEDEAYQTLRAWIELQLPAPTTRIVLLTSAVHSEGKTTATARLGQALAEAGSNVLLVSGDLRRPTLHNLFGVETGSGVSEIIEEVAADPEVDAARFINRHLVQLGAPSDGPRGAGELALLTSGMSPDAAVRSLSAESVAALFGGLRQVNFDYVLVDGPPLLGIADSTILAQEADDLLVVARLDRLTVENAVDLRELIGRLATPALGLLVIGTPSEASPYYLPSRPAPREQRSPAPL